MTTTYPTLTRPGEDDATFLPAVAGTEPMVLDLLDRRAGPPPLAPTDRRVRRLFVDAFTSASHTKTKRWLAWTGDSCAALLTVTADAGATARALVLTVAEGVDGPVQAALQELATALAHRCGRDLVRIDVVDSAAGVGDLWTAIEAAADDISVGDGQGQAPTRGRLLDHDLIAWHDDDATLRASWARAA